MPVIINAIPNNTFQTWGLKNETGLTIVYMPASNMVKNMPTKTNLIITLGQRLVNTI